MKKKIVCLLVTAVMAVSMIACGSSEQAKQVAQDNSSETVVDGDNVVENTPIAIEVSKESFEGSSNPDEVEFLYNYSYEKPVVTISGNEEAQRKIQAELDKVIDNFLTQVTNNEFGIVLEDNAEPSFMGLTYKVIRADEKVLSILFSNEGYDHGAHGWNNVFYRNFYVSNGEQITFDSIGADFREKSLELVDVKRIEYGQKVAEQEGYSPFFDECEKYYPYVVCDGTELNSDVAIQIYGESLYEEGDTSTLEPMFAVTDTGFIFTSGQYALQAYAAGIIDFEIDKAEYGDVITADLF